MVYKKYSQIHKAAALHYCSFPLKEKLLCVIMLFVKGRDTVKRSSLKSIIEAVKEELSCGKNRTDTDELRFEAFFRGAAMRYISANKLATDIDALSSTFPEVFSKLSKDSPVISAAENVCNILSDIPDSAWENNVQLIGQLYQYFNSDAKEAALSGLKRSVKVGAENISAATQIFTPDWIVRYMTENTLGNAFAGCCSFDTSQLTYHIAHEYTHSPCAPEDISFLDPCMGSGNILTAALDLFMDLYTSMGYDRLEAVKLCLSRNIFGLDIDSRMRRMSHFALIMRAAHYAPEILNCGITLNLYDTEDLGGDNDFSRQFAGSALFGSLLRPTVPPMSENSRAAKVYELLTRKYSVVVTNPPYLSCGNMSSQLLRFIKENYPDSRADLFSAFIQRCTELAEPDGFLGFLTPYVWMFIQSYEKLRRMMFTERTIESLVQFEYSAFEEATVPVCAFTMLNRKTSSKGVYFRLTEFRGGLEVQREKLLEAIASPDCSYVFRADADDFSKLPNAPAAYWLSDNVRKLFSAYPPLGSIAAPRKGNSTSDNDRFLRLWFEVDRNKLNLDSTCIDREDTLQRRWFPYNKGGGYRKWYGFNDYVIDWFDDGAEIRAIPTAVVANYRYFTKAGLTWSTLTSGKFSIRQFGNGYIFDNGGCCIFDLGDKKHFICALLNSKVFAYIFGQLNPTLNFQSGEVAKFPVIYKRSAEADRLAAECTEISKAEYDSFETSRDFKKHPLI